MASAKLIRSASNRRVRILSDPERAPLLDHDNRRRSVVSENAVDDGAPFHPYPFIDLPVYENIWRIRKDLLEAVNDPYSLEQIRAPRLTTTVVRPLLDQYYALNDVSIVFCLLVNRVQFLRNQSIPHHYQSVNTTRAKFCEVLAARLLRQFDEDSSGPNGLLLLSNVVIAGFDPFQNCPNEISRTSSRTRWIVQQRRGYEKQMTALEVAILSESKLFLSSPACQKVTDAIYTGRIIYTPTSFIDILPDHYKHMAISIYDPVKAPYFNQYRLNVPRTQNICEVAQFLVLLALYFWVMMTKDPFHFSMEEFIFCTYGFGWILHQLASMLEHGWQVYSQNLWSFLDVTFAIIFLVYFPLRMHGLKTDSVRVSQPALDLLAMGAPFLVPRLAFNVFSENLVFVSLRDMMARFFLLMILAVWSFAGFFLAMFWLSDREIAAVQIGKWMVWVWFGLDGTGIQKSVEFHWLFGPVLMIAFAVLGNTLFLTILVSTLSSSFAKISAHSMAEIQFRKAVLTFEGAKSDAIFAYPPPFNILALVILLPLKIAISPRWFHKVNITLVRIINAPALVVIGLYERSMLWPSDRGRPQSGKRRRPKFGGFDWFRVHGDIDAVFESPPPTISEREADFGDFDLQDDGPDRSTGSLRFKKSRSRSGESKESGGEGNKTVERRLSRIEELLGQISDMNGEEDNG